MTGESILGLLSLTASLRLHTFATPRRSEGPSVPATAGLGALSMWPLFCASSIQALQDVPVS